MSTLEEARSLLRQGRVADAERQFERALETSPNDAQALNVVALAALRTGNLPRARELLQRATAAHPQDALSHHHLGRVCDAIGDLKSGLAAHAQAVKLRPDFHLARLSLASALERAGDARGALLQFTRALSEAQAEGRWVDATSTPAPLRPMLEHAVSVVRQGRRQVLAQLLEPLVKTYGRNELTRVERCIRVHLREEFAESPDARQKPTFLYFPGLGESAYIDRSRFDWIEALEAQTELIRAELMALLPSSQGRERVFTTEDLERQNLRGLDVPPSWNGYYFYRHGVRRDDNCSSCPATAQALERLPLVHVREHGPEVLYSVFTPGTHLLPHCGVTNTRLVGHLALLIPEDCALKVGGEIYHWVPGKVVVFDDTYEHEAWNRSQQTRVVMIFDVWHPGLTQAERHAVADLVAGIGDFRKEVEAA
jgi:aspartate beta-hydroxylase